MSISAGRRRLIMLLILVPVFIGALDLTIVSAILPEVLTKLNIPIDTGLGSASWAVTGYLLAYTVSMVVMGRVSDLVGRRAVYLICLGIFVAGSWWVAVSGEFPTALLSNIALQYLHQHPDTNQMTLLAVIIGRVVQAFGAGAMVPISIALIGDLFPPDQRSTPVGIIGALDTAGWVLGHLYGGLAVKFFHDHGADIAAALNTTIPDWRTLFWINVPIGLIALLLTGWALRGIPTPRAGGRFDVIGAILAALALIGLGIGLGGTGDVSTSTSLDSTAAGANALPFNLPILVGAAVCLIAFLAWEWRTRDPLIDLHLFRKRNISAASLTNLVVGFCLMLGLVSVPLLVNLRAKDASAESIANSAQVAGLMLSAFTIPMALTAVLGGSLSNRIGYRATVAGGLMLAFVGLLAAGLTWGADTSSWLMAGELLLVGVGLGLTISPIGTAVINEAGDAERGVTSALVIILRLVGMTVAIAALTNFALARVTQMVNDAVAQFPAGLSAAAVQKQSETAYFTAGVHAVDELLLIGAVACLLGLIPALMLRGSALVRPKAENLTPRPPLRNHSEGASAGH